MDWTVRPCRALDARLSVPGDKALSHRAAILLALSRKGGRISGFSSARDCASTLEILRALGAGISREGEDLRMAGGGWEGFRAPAGPLDCGNSGSTLRMLAGVLAGCPFEARLTGDASLIRRPMARVAEPLGRMGADVACEGPEDRPPLRIRGGTLQGIAYESPVTSAQVKTAVLLAGLRASGRTTFREPIRSRDHTERMLAHLGVPITVSGPSVSVEGDAAWEGTDFEIPGDPSSAAFFLVAAACRRGWKAEVRGVCLNPSRMGFVEVLARMGAEVSVRENRSAGGEPVGAIRVEGADLKGTRIAPGEIPGLIDELPVLALAATQARGATVVEGAGELRHKESDRIEALAAGLNALGARVETLPDGFRIQGATALQGAAVESAGDHRIAMMLALAGLLAEGDTVVKGAECIGVSFPEFPGLLAGGCDRIARS